MRCRRSTAPWLWELFAGENLTDMLPMLFVVAFSSCKGSPPDRFAGLLLFCHILVGMLIDMLLRGGRVAIIAATRSPVWTSTAVNTGIGFWLCALMYAKSTCTTDLFAALWWMVCCSSFATNTNWRPVLFWKLCEVVLLYLLPCWHAWRCCCLCSDCWLVFLVV